MQQGKIYGMFFPPLFSDSCFMQTLHFPCFPLLSPHACFLGLGFMFQVRNELLVGTVGFLLFQALTRIIDRKNKYTKLKELSSPAMEQ